MDRNEWKPMSSAPKDGTLLIRLYSDKSGVGLICWGTYQEDETKEGWFDVEGDKLVDESLVEDDDYWIAAPDMPNV